jgi:hypothetical protein
MISCTEFIPAYSELFKYIERRGGKQDVMEFWNYLSENYLSDLRSYVDKDGIDGCWEYWSHSLNEEAADFVMTLDDEKGEFTIDMRHCPSKGKLLSLDYMEPYDNYCGHCDILYRRNLEPRGFKYEYDFSKCDEAKCILKITKKK